MARGSPGGESDRPGLRRPQGPSEPRDCLSGSPVDPGSELAEPPWYTFRTDHYPGYIAIDSYNLQKARYRYLTWLTSHIPCWCFHNQFYGPPLSTDTGIAQGRLGESSRRPAAVVVSCRPHDRPCRLHRARPFGHASRPGIDEVTRFVLLSYSQPHGGRHACCLSTPASDRGGTFVTEVRSRQRVRRALGGRGAGNDLPGFGIGICCPRANVHAS